MKLFAKTIMMMLLVASFAVEKANAQNFWGTGMAMGMGSCGYQVDVGDEAESIQDEISKYESDIKEIKSALLEKQKEERELKRNIDSNKRKIKRTIDDKPFAFISSHIESNGAKCSDYVKAAPAPRSTNSVDTPPVTSTGSGNLKPTDPLKPETWTSYCNPQTNDVETSICIENSVQKKGAKEVDLCRSSLDEYQKQYKQQLALKAEIEALKAQIVAATKDKKSLEKDKKAAINDYMKQKREEMTEGGCVDCYLAGNSGGIYAPRKSSGLEVAANVALGLGAMYFGNRLNQYVSDNNAKLGFATQSYPSFGYGYPYFMGALYGAVGGGVGSGAFGCGGGVGGGGFPMGPYGMMGPYAMGGLYGPGGMGGAFGYPQGMYGPSMGGGMYLPGMGPGGMAGPWGLGGMGGLGGMMGMGNPYGMGGMGGMGMCIQAPCPVGGMGAGGFPYGMGGMNPFGMGGMGGMNPFGMGGMGGMNPYGMGMGGMAGLGMGYPGMMGMGNPFGMGGMGGMNPYGMGMGGMGGMNPYGMGMGGMGGMNPYGMGMGGMGGMNPFGMGGMMNPYGMGGPGMMGMGGMDPFGMGGMGGMGGMMGAQAQMQMQMQQMQMQMQQYQQMMDMQRRKYDQYVQQQRVVGQLTQEISSLYMRLQQAQMGMYSGGYLGFEGNANYNVQGGVNYNTLPYQTNQYQYQTNPYQPGYNPGYQQPGGRLNVR